MATECVMQGGNAIVAMRFDTAAVVCGTQIWWEVCAYGTACFVEESGIREMIPDPFVVPA